MSETESDLEDIEAEEVQPVLGESPKEAKVEAGVSHEIIIQDKILTFEEASKCLNTLGKDESCLRYAYIRFTACDMKLTDIKTLLNFRHVLFVDVSGNYLQTPALQAITGMPFMVQLHAQRNFIDSCALHTMCYLQDLSLARNRIRDTIGVVQPSLEYLDLNYNQIYQAVLRSEDLPELRELELRGNYLFEVSGIFPVTLEKLYLAENKITRFIKDDLCKLENLKVLHVRNNLLRKLDGLSGRLKQLKYLNLRENKITKIRQFRKLQILPNLEVLIILQNPVSVEKHGGKTGEEFEGEEPGEGEEETDPNRVKILALLPNLKRINKTTVSFTERERAHINRNQLLAEIMDEDSSEDEFEAPSTTTELFSENMHESSSISKKLTDIIDPLTDLGA